MKLEKLENLEALRKIELATPRAIEVLLELLESSTGRIKLAAASKILELAANNKLPRLLPDEKPQTLDEQITFLSEWSVENAETNRSA
jgi:HEAT repeat protein